MEKNLLIMHGGGPTAVMNGSLYGAIKEAKTHPEIAHIYAAKNGSGGILREEFISLENVSEEKLKLLLQTPGSAIGTSRDQLELPEYKKMVQIIKKYNIGYVLCNGGNGTMDTCGKLYKVCEEENLDVKVMGIPKTMDNDIAVTDHSPGFGSAARYIARSVREVAADVRSLSIHVVVIEASGRNAGWITAASALANMGDGLSPDLIYLPERPFDEDRFLHDVKQVLKRKKGVLVVASEGLKNQNGDPIVKPIFQTGRATYYGDISSHLANLVVQRLGYKARGEKPGLLGRASISLQSSIDLHEAILAGKIACKAAVNGHTGKMVAFKRISTTPYQIEPFIIDIDKVMLHEKTMPDQYINADGNGVTENFIEWCRPLLGESMPDMISFNFEQYPNETTH